jgi:hypothetical protein
MKQFHYYGVKLTKESFEKLRNALSLRFRFLINNSYYQSVTYSGETLTFSLGDTGSRVLNSIQTENISSFMAGYFAAAE